MADAGLSLPDLPHMIQMQILSYLNTEQLLSVSKVCADWTDVTENEELWKKMSFSGETVPTAEIKELLLQKSQFLKELSLTSRHDSDDILTTLTETCPNLQALSLSYCRRLTNNTWARLVRNCSEITSFSLCVQSENPRYLLRKALKWKKLTVLSIVSYESWRVPNNTTDLKPENIQNFTELVLRGVFSEGDIWVMFNNVKDTLLKLTIDVRYMTEENCLALGCCQRLVELKIYKLTQKNMDTGNILLERIANLKHLQSLAIHYSYVSANIMAIMLSTSPSVNQLKKLDITGCWKVDDRCLEAVAYNCHLLNHLEITCGPKITDQGVEYIIQGCKRLTYVALHLCSQVTDGALARLVESSKDLRVFDITGFRASSKFLYDFIQKNVPWLVFRQSNSSPPSTSELDIADEIEETEI